MTQPTFCNVCDSEIIDTSVRRCPSCGVYLSPAKNPVVSYDSKSTGSKLDDPLAADPIGVDSIAEPEKQSDNLPLIPGSPQSDLLHKDEQAIDRNSADENTSGIAFESCNGLEPSKLHVVETSRSEIISFGEIQNGSKFNNSPIDDQTSSTSDDYFPLENPLGPIEPATKEVKSKPSVVASEMELGGKTESWTTEEQNPGSPFPTGGDVTLSNSIQPISTDFAHIKMYRAKALQIAGIVLGLWSLLICWKTGWSIVPAVGGFILATAGLIYKNNRLGWVAIAICTATLPVIYLVLRWLHM